MFLHMFWIATLKLPRARQTVDPTSLRIGGVGHMTATAGGAEINLIVITKLLTYARVALLTHPMKLITRLESAVLQVQRCIKAIVRS